MDRADLQLNVIGAAVKVGKREGVVYSFSYNGGLVGVEFKDGSVKRFKTEDVQLVKCSPKRTKRLIANKPRCDGEG